MIKKILSILFAIIIISVTPVYADDEDGLKIGDKFVVDNGTIVEFMGMSDDGLYLLKATIGAPMYLDDLTTPIDCRWEYNSFTQTWQSAANLYDASVNGTKVTVNYKGKNTNWQPDLYIGTTLQKPVSTTASLLFTDPINQNYYTNTIQWTYSNGITRNLRIIEGMLQEYWTIPTNPNDFVTIAPNISKDVGFIYTRPTEAWGSDRNNLDIIIDDTGTITIPTNVLDNSKYPITIDPDTSFTTTSSDGYLQYADAAYATARTAATAEDIYTSSSVLKISNTKNVNYYLQRAFVYFDTSSLPDGCTVTAATLKLYGDTDGSATNFNIQVQSGAPTYPHSPLVVGDYDRTHYSGNGGQLSTVGFSTSGYNDLVLNATGYGWISLTGTTKYALISDRDIAGTSPSGFEYVFIKSYEAGSGYWPLLEVTYVASAAPTVTAQAASDVALTTARLNGSIDDDGGGDVELRWGYGTTSQTAGNFALYDTVTAWDGEDYHTGENVYLDVASLAPNTPYYYRFQAQNDAGTTTSGEITFTTLNGVADPSNFKGYPEASYISLNWTKGAGTTNSVIRYSTTAFPTLISEGIEAYNGTSSSFTHTGLDAGTTYYYSVWGESGGTYSTNYAYVMVTTSAVDAGGASLETPGTPTRWLTAPNYTNLSNIPIIYDAVNMTADSLDMPRASMWLMVAMIMAGGLGLVVFVVSKSLAIATVALMCAIVFGWAVELIPFWIPIMTVILIFGLYMSRREVTA